MKLRNPILLRKLRTFYFRNRWTHSEIRDYLREHYDIEVSSRTLKRWKNKLSDNSWEGPISPLPPVNIKVTQEQILRICALRNKTGWGALPIKHIFKFDLSERTYTRIIKANGLSRGSKIENKRIHWVKWQRDHPDSLWQLDAHKDEDDNWLLPVIDDCSRYCFGIRKFKTMTTAGVISYLEDLFKINGVPRELLTDNGSEFGGICRTSQFDKWCERRNIKHIRSRIHKPTTTGKIERHHLTYKNEISFCNNDIEMFRYRYNHVRPHRSLHMKTPAQVYFDLQIRLKITEKKPKKKWG